MISKYAIRECDDYPDPPDEVEDEVTDIRDRAREFAKGCNATTLTMALPYIRLNSLAQLKSD
jgi:hypothetical protein